MARSETVDRTSEASWTRAGTIGLLGGVAAAVVMAGYAMAAAATYQDTGFFTPLYHIGSAFGTADAQRAMEASMERAGTGDLYHFDVAPAALGMAIHMITGAGWGLLFGLLVRGARIARASVLPAGVVFGIAVMAVMAWAVLPATAELFDSGAPIRDMPSMVGWGTFTIEHALFGFVVGAAAVSLASASPARARQRFQSRAAGHRAPAS